MKRELRFRILQIIIISACVCASAIAQGNGHKPDDVAMELIGQVIATPTTATQVGYLSYINGLDSPIFTGAPQNETTALFTFYSDNVTTRVINNGPLRIINREEGTFTIYFDGTPNGNFSNPDTFRDGQPVLTASLRHQVIIDTITGAFTATFVLTVTSNDPFVFSGRAIRMGKVGDKLRLTFNGHTNSPAPPAGHIAGFIVGDSLIKPEK